MVVTTGDINRGWIQTVVRGYPTAEFILNSGITVPYDEQIEISGNYTRSGSTTSTLIFRGRIIDKDKQILQKITCESYFSEIEYLKPEGAYCGTKAGQLTDMIDDYCVNVTYSFTTGISPHMYRAPHNFRNIADGGFPTTYWTREQGGTSTVEIVSDLLGHEKVMEFATPDQDVGMYHTDAERQFSGTVEFYIYLNTEVETFYVRINIGGGENSGISLRFFVDGGIDRLDAAGAYQAVQAFSAQTWYKIKISWDVTDVWELWIDDVLKSGAGFPFRGDMSAGMLYVPHFDNQRPSSLVYIDAFGSTGDGDYIAGTFVKKQYEELDYSDEFLLNNFTKQTSIIQHLEEYVDRKGQSWFVDILGDLDINYLDAPSGKFLSGNQEIWGVKGTEQVKRINTVIIRGGLIAGEQIDYTAQDASLTGAAGIVYYVDTYPDITDETVLSGIAANILDREKQAPLECNLFYRNESEGLYQVGETVYVSGGIIFNKNGDTIPENDYIIKGCKYYIRSGNYKAIDFNIADGLVFRKEVGDSLPEQNYVAIQQNAADIHDIEVGAAPDHNLLDGLNAGTNYEHITQTQKDALHAIIVAGDLNHNDLADLNDGVNYEHITQTQKDLLAHLDQDVKIASEPAFGALTLTNTLILGGNITVGGTVDGVDIAGRDHAKYTDAEAKTYIEANTKLDDLQTPDDNTDLNATTTEHGLLKKLDNSASNFMNGQGNWAEPVGGAGVSQADFDAVNAIGIGNKRWKKAVYAGAGTGGNVNVAGAFHNVGSTDYAMVFDVMLPFVINGKNLVITDTRVIIGDADADDYLNRLRIFGYSGSVSQTTLVDDGTNRTTNGVFTYGHADQTIGGSYFRAQFYLEVFSTTANQFDFYAIEFEYYYA